MAIFVDPAINAAFTGTDDAAQFVGPLVTERCQQPPHISSSRSMDSGIRADLISGALPKVKLLQDGRPDALRTASGFAERAYPARACLRTAGVALAGKPIASPTAAMPATNCCAAATTGTDVVETIPFHRTATLMTIDGAQRVSEQVFHVRISTPPPGGPSCAIAALTISKPQAAPGAQGGRETGK